MNDGVENRSLSFPICIGAVTRLLGAPEHKLQYAIRSKKVEPNLVAGRRLWQAADVLAAEAAGAGKLTDAMRASLQQIAESDARAKNSRAHPWQAKRKAAAVAV